ncbi:MAG: hypothetical protein ACYDD1_17450 [Caulobacteraceae bacterium]
MELGLKASSKGHISGIETRAIFASLQLALHIERWSGGCVQASSLIDPADAALLDAHVLLRATDSAGVAA